MIDNLIADLEALHVPTLDAAGRKICEHCAELCHSHSGLQCDEPTDGAWPCETMKIVISWSAP
jgi:hypothetical protein